MARMTALPESLLEDVLSFLETPVDFLRLGAEASQTLHLGRCLEEHPHWEVMYRSKWPAFYEALCSDGETEWKRLYKETLSGSCCCLLEVFGRLKKPGLVFSAMPALCSWDGAGYIARHLSASSIEPERIPSSEEHRLRFCPPSARLLRPRGQLAIDQDAPISVAQDALAASYPYSVLQDEGNVLSGMRPGQPVELQWKGQELSPFGWWLATFEALEVSGGEAIAHLCFPHLPVESPWRRVAVPLGLSSQAPCTDGGFTGGIRAVTPAEKDRWTVAFQEEPRDWQDVDEMP